MRIMLLIVVFVLLAAHFVLAKDVSMNFAFSINGKAGDTITVNETDYVATGLYDMTFINPAMRYVLANDGNVLFALISAGQDLRRIRMHTGFTVNEYLVSMSQSDKNNRFLIGFTNGTKESMENIQQGKIISKTAGSITLPAPASHTLFILLESPFDITNYEKFSGTTKLFVRNHGSVMIPNITVENER